MMMYRRYGESPTRGNECYCVAHDEAVVVVVDVDDDGDDDDCVTKRTRRHCRWLLALS